MLTIHINPDGSWTIKNGSLIIAEVPPPIAFGMAAKTIANVALSQGVMPPDAPAASDPSKLVVVN